MASLHRLELNNTTTLAASLLVGENINPINLACLAHMVFEKLPIRIPVEIRQKNTPAPHILLVFLEIFLIKNLISNHLPFRVLLTIAIFLRKFEG